MSNTIFESGGSGNGGLRLGTGVPIDFQPTERERQFRQWLLHDVLGTPEYKEHATWVGDQLIIGGFELPISQILGFPLTAPQRAAVIGTSSTTSTTYTDLADGAGPQLTGLADGIYLFLYGAATNNSGAGFSYLSIQVNSDAVSENDATSTNATARVGLMYATVKTLSNDGNNTVTVKYRADAGTAGYYSRVLVSLRVSNP